MNKLPTILGAFFVSGLLFYSYQYAKENTDQKIEHRQDNLMQKGFVINIEKASIANTYFRQVLFTTKNTQLVLMSLKPGEDIGEEVHHLDQFIRCETGQGKTILDGVTHEISDGFAILVPSGVKHNIINTSSEKPLKLYTLYSPPNHRDGVIHKTKAEAEADEEHFDGLTSED